MVIALLAGCNKTAEPEPEPTATPAVTDASATPDVSTPAPTATAEPTAAPTEEPGPVATAEPTAEPAPTEAAPENIEISISHMKDYIFSEDDSYTCGYFCYDLFELGEEDAAKYPRLSEAFDDLNECNLGSVIDVGAMFRGMVTADSGYECFEIERYRIVRADSNIVCFAYDGSEFTGGVRPYDIKSGICYDPATGDRLEIADIVTDRDAFIDLVYNKLLDENPELEMSISNEQLMAYIGDAFDEGTLNFIVGHGYVQVIFNGAEISFAADGAYSVEIPFKGYEDMFEEQYIVSSEEYILFADEENHRFIVDLDGDGIAESLSYTLTYESELHTGDIESVRFYINGREASEQIRTYYSYEVIPVLIVSKYGNFIYLQMGYDSSDESTWVFKIDLDKAPDDITDADLIKTVTRAGDWDLPRISNEASYSPYDMVMYDRIDFLGTTYPDAHYGITESGNVENIYGWYDLATWDGDYWFTAKTDIVMKKYDPATDTILGDYTVTAGTGLGQYRSDLETYVEFVLEDNTHLRMGVAKQAMDEYWTKYVPADYDCDFTDLFDGLNFCD